MIKILIISGIGILFAILIVAVSVIIAKNRKNVAVIGDDETVASARVIEIFDTGDRYNHNPVVTLKLEVIPTSALPYQAEIKTVISVVDVPSFQAGCVLRVKYKKNNPADVVVIGK